MLKWLKRQTAPAVRTRYRARLPEIVWRISGSNRMAKQTREVVRSPDYLAITEGTCRFFFILLFLHVLKIKNIYIRLFEPYTDIFHITLIYLIPPLFILYTYFICIRVSTLRISPFLHSLEWSVSMRTVQQGLHKSADSLTNQGISVELFNSVPLIMILSRFKKKKEKYMSVVHIYVSGKISVQIKTSWMELVKSEASVYFKIKVTKAYIAKQNI